MGFCTSRIMNLIRQILFESMAGFERDQRELDKKLERGH